MDKVVIPHNVEAEKALLGAILIAKDKSIVIDEVNQIIKSTDFYRKANQVIYLTILDLFNTRKDIDSITLTEKTILLRLLMKLRQLVFHRLLLWLIIETLPVMVSILPI